MSESFKQLFEESIAHTNLVSGSLVTAKVIGIDDDYVTLHAGLKSEGIVTRNEFYDSQGQLEVDIGDDVEVVLDAVEDGFGESLFSREKAKRQVAWRNLEKSYAADEAVTGIIFGKVKGGFTVDIGQIRAFLPGSLVDVRPVRDPSYLEGKELSFKVIKMDPRRNNIVVSRRAIVEQENSAERKALLDSLQEGEETTGIVKNITDYGAFVDLGGVDGLLHITDIAWRRIKHPSEVLTVGQEIRVKVLSFDRKRNRVSLGMKQLESDPWSDLVERIPEGTYLTGKVTNITDYGCFVEIQDGIEGLVHMSEMDWTNKNIHPNKVVQLEQMVDVVVLEIDQERRRISLGMKQRLPNPWEQFAEAHQKGEKISGKIRSITDFGVFIGLDGGIDGLIHLSDISWQESGEQAVRHFKKGQELEAVILSIDAERERISLGIKQLSGDPFEDYSGQHAKDSMVTGTIKQVKPKVVLVELAEGVEGCLRISEMAEATHDLSDVFHEDETLEARILNIDKKNRTVNLSLKSKGDTNSMSSASMQEAPKTTLGDLLKEKIEDMQQKE